MHLAARLRVVGLLAGRFLFSKSADGFLSMISWVSVAGVALGMLALTVVTSVINGFEGELARVITGLNGDVILYTRGDPIADTPEVEGKIRQVVPSAQAVTRSFVTELMVAGEKGVAGAVLEGFDPASFGQVTDVERKVIRGSFPVANNEIALGSSLARTIGAEPGQIIRLVAPSLSLDEGEGAVDEASIGAPRVREFQVSGIVHIGMHQYDSKFVFVPLQAAQDFLSQKGSVTSYKVKLADRTSSIRAASDLSDHFGYPYRAKDWGQLNKNLFYAIKLEKAVIGIILGAIILVAAFNVVSTLMMMVHDKTREIAILKAMGMDAFQGFALFCLIGTGIGAVGIGLGVSLGMALNALLARTQWITLPADIYYIGFLPVTTRWTEIGWIAAVALLISFFATVYPAWQVSRRSPLEGIRYD